MLKKIILISALLIAKNICAELMLPIDKVINVELDTKFKKTPGYKVRIKLVGGETGILCCYEDWCLFMSNSIGRPLTNVPVCYYDWAKKEYEKQKSAK